MASSFTDENIDPSLLTMDPNMDPAQKLMARMRANPPSLTLNLPPPNDENIDNNDQLDLPSSIAIPINLSAPSNSSLAAFGRLVKRQVNLSDASSVAFDQFCQTRSADERQALVYAGVLQMLDLAKKNDKDTVWTIPPDLHRRIVGYVRAFVFSPTTVCYRGINVGEHILKAMRECNVKNLPEEDDIIAVGLVLALIRSKGTHYRNTFKTKVKASMARNSSMRNIATLSHKLLKDTGVKPTVQFYQRVAFIRWCLSNYPNLSEEDFWPKGVDNSIATFRHQHKTQEELDACFNTIYEDDKVEYGKPEDTDLTTVDFSTTPDWQVTLGERTKNIQPQPVSKKRKIGEVEDDDDEGGE
ncbi:hypothetical protein DFH08DRAFT_977745 [Mycena albidolilacea]|uniref:Uncharacterized protein n=1 Tax=Mycena albidolilacea TaxID=1033008 RepID=A0AAD6Z0B0_9AGAR|nr:hypothetical protein DFH08DRAFT_977745 [Mycena albidolilacea]